MTEPGKYTSSTLQQTVTFREGAVRELEGLLNHMEAKHLFFVMDEPAYKHSGAAEALAGTLRNRKVTRFSGFELNPKIEDAERGILLFLEEKPDTVIALGGGSALDMAKVIAVCSVQEGPLQDYVTGARTPERPGPPMIAVPTTSGTGSEATHFAVVYIDGRKYSLAHPFLTPEYVIIDPELTQSLPSGVTAASGLDALCQAVESVWAAGSTDESVTYALEALSLVLNNLETAVNRPDPPTRMAMARAAHLSGKAINISKTTAPHAVSYAITSGFKVPHGMAVALTLGAFLDYNYRIDEISCTDSRGTDSVKMRIGYILKEMGVGSVEQARQRLQSIFENIDCPLRLRDVSIKESDLAGLVQQVNTERLSNNPREIDARGLLTLLKSIL